MELESSLQNFVNKLLNDLKLRVKVADRTFRTKV